MIYLDYQATTPLAPEAREAMLPWLGGPGSKGFGNPYSPHRLGRIASAAVELARDQVAAPFAGEPGRLIFTSGATEAANWAIKGALAAAPPSRRKLVTIATEHACVLDSAAWLAREGIELVILPVGGDGLIDIDLAREAIDDRTALVAAMLVNNEIGAIQPIDLLAARTRDVGALFFCDAVQGFCRAHLPIGLCDMVAISAHKLHGPKGIGALWLRDRISPAPLLHGGAQEAGLRSGTLSPMLCAGFGAAVQLAFERSGDTLNVDKLFDVLLDALGPAWVLNGSAERRYLGNANLRRHGVDAARLIADVRSVAFSAGSACASGSGRPSHVLKAIGLSDAEARASIRLGFGRYTTAAEIEEAAALINIAAGRQLEWV